MNEYMLNDMFFKIFWSSNWKFPFLKQKGAAFPKASFLWPPGMHPGQLSTPGSQTPPASSLMDPTGERRWKGSSRYRTHGLP